MVYRKFDLNVPYVFDGKVFACRLFELCLQKKTNQLAVALYTLLTKCKLLSKQNYAGTIKNGNVDFCLQFISEYHYTQSAI